ARPHAHAVSGRPQGHKWPIRGPNRRLSAPLWEASQAPAGQTSTARKSERIRPLHHHATCPIGPMATNPSETIHLLVVEDSELDFELLLAILGRDQALTGLRVRAQRVEDEAGMRAALGATPIDAVVTDHNLPRFDSFAAIKTAKQFDEDLPVLVLSGEMAEDLAVTALHAGADDFILKARMFRLAPALRRSLQAAEVRRNARKQAQALAESEAKLHALTQHLERVKEEERRVI